MFFRKALDILSINLFGGDSSAVNTSTFTVTATSYELVVANWSNWSGHQQAFTKRIYLSNAEQKKTMPRRPLVVSLVQVSRWFSALTQTMTFLPARKKEQNGCSWEMFFMQKMIQKHCVLQ